MFSVALLLLLAAGSCVKCEQLTQPDSVTVQPGQRLSITCQVSYSVSEYRTHWLRQPAGKELEWIGSARVGYTTYYKDSLKNKFSIDLESTSKTLTLNGHNMQPEDSAVYYCARAGAGYFDYWGKGTTVTVTSATTTGPSVFPLIQCGSGTGDTVNLGCLATGFTPSSLTFKWTKNGLALTDFIKYPAVEKNNFYTGVSQIQVTRQDWESSQRFKCAVEHVGGNVQTPEIFRPTPPNVNLVSVPSENSQAMMCMIEDGHGGTLNSFKWKKNGVKVDDFISSTIQKIGDSHSAVSVLKVKNTEWDSKAVYTCEVTYQGQTYTKKVSKGPITVTLNQPSPKEMFNNNQTVLDCVITGQDKAVVDEIEITWKIDGENVTGQTGVATSEDGQYRKTSTMTRSHTEWKAAKKVSCSAVREDMTPIVQELTVNKGDGSEPKVTVLIEEIKPSEVTVVCLVFSSVLQDYYIAWSELKDNVSGNYVNGINFPEQKTPKGYLVTSVYTTTNKESEKKVFNCNVWPAGRNEAMTPHGVSLSQGYPKLCISIEDNGEEDEFSSLWSTASSFIFLFISSLFYSMIFSLVKMKRP